MTIKVYNTLTRQKEEFVPITPGKANIYVCGVTPYNHPHVGNARPFVTWDVIRRFLEHEGYDVTHVQNFTDVDDKIINTANKEGVQWFDICNRYIDSYFEVMDKLNVRRAHVYPRVSEHIDDIIETVQTLIDNGYAYVVDGDVFYSVEKFKYYGQLSGRNLEDMMAGARVDVDERKHNPMDFALWKSAKPGEPSWASPWGNGRPGWHIECSTMSMKYLGKTFDFHGGGSDLIFPHHECEIAQSVASQGHDMVRYWMHNNMITINGQKMGKSLGNFITLDEFFTGSNKLLTQAYSAMTIRFFILQAHYRSTVDFSNEALQAAEKGLERMMEGVKNLERITPSKTTSGIEPAGLREKCYEAMNDDLNTPIVISHLFDAIRMINTVIDKKATISADDLEELKSVFHTFVFDILGLKAEAENNAAREEAFGKVVDMLLEQRMQAKANKDWATSDKIRDTLAALGFEVKDTKDGFTWKLNK